MTITGQTTVEQWLDDATVAYIGACVLLNPFDEGGFDTDTNYKSPWER